MTGKIVLDTAIIYLLGFLRIVGTIAGFVGLLIWYVIEFTATAIFYFIPSFLIGLLLGIFVSRAWGGHHDGTGG